MTQDRIIHLKESELRQVVQVMVQQTLVDMLGLSNVTQQPKPEEWLETREAARLLNHAPASLNAKRRNGWFELGKHYRIANANPSAQGTGVRYEYHVDRCKARLSESPSKWKRPTSG